jgi:hypothetical protein
MERNIDDFLADPELYDRLESLTEEEQLELFEKQLEEAFGQIMTPFQNNNVQIKDDANLKPLNRSTSSRDYAYGGKSSAVIKRQDKVKLSKNKDLNITKSAIRSAFKAIIAASNKTSLGGQVTSVLRTTEKRLFQMIDQKLKMEDKNKGK